jgi:shikimate dehydrogenase
MVAVLVHVDGLAKSDRLIGAVNCVVLREGQLIAENTDGQEFLTALRGVTDPLGQRLVVFDAGGAARTIAVERPRLPAQLR